MDGGKEKGCPIGAAEVAREERLEICKDKLEEWYEEVLWQVIREGALHC